MKVLSVVGITLSGKTTTVETIIAGLKKRRYSVGSVKDIHFEDFAIDTQGSNTHRHSLAGADLVSARGIYETDILYKQRLSMKEILRSYHHEFVILEGVSDFDVPKIITAHSLAEIDQRMDETVFLISGRIADEITEYKGIPVIHPIREKERLVDEVEKKVFPVLPNVLKECCGECGLSCKELVGEILKGKRARKDCRIEKNQAVELRIDGERISMVPFVQALLKNAVQGVTKELEGGENPGKIEVILHPPRGKASNE